MTELKEINETLKKIEIKLEDHSRKDCFSWISNLFDFEKSQEKSRKEREEKRNEELLQLQKSQTEAIIAQTKIEERQEEFNRIVALTGAILALIGIYTFVKDLGLVNQTNFWISYIFLAFVVIAIGPIIAFMIKSYFWRK